MKIKRLVLVAFLAMLTLSFGSSISEARIGGGRSFGSMGSRGFGSRPMRSFNSAPSQAQSAPRPFGSRPDAVPSSPSGGGSFSRGLLGGLAGGVLGSMLFRQLGFAGPAMPGSGGGIGIFEILIFAGLGFFIFRLLTNRTSAQAPASYPSYSATSQNEQVDRNDEQANANRIRMYDANFDLENFKETRMDDFMRLQSAWNFRDLSSVSTMVAPEILGVLNSDIAKLKSDRQINRIENIAVRGVQLVDTWQEFGKEYATLRFRANLVDYTVDETSGNVLSGDRVVPVKFEEDWTFARDISGGASAKPWVLSAIEN